MRESRAAVCRLIGLTFGIVVNRRWRCPWFLLATEHILVVIRCRNGKTSRGNLFVDAVVLGLVAFVVIAVIQRSNDRRRWGTRHAPYARTPIPKY
jgi:hypothetical protein